MKVYIQNATGSQKAAAMLDKDSGVIEFATGELSHILFEKQSGKIIEAYVEGHHCKMLPVKKEEPKEEVKEVVSEASIEQSKESKKKKTK